MLPNPYNMGLGTTTQAKRDSLLYQIQLYANLLGGSVRLPSSASDDTDTATEGTQKKKRKRESKKTGRKSNEEKDAHDYMVKFMALDFFMDEKCRSTYKFCHDKEMGFLFRSVDRFVQSEERLNYIRAGIMKTRTYTFW